MVLNILMIPLTSYIPYQNEKNIVEASQGETIINGVFLTAVLSLFAITALQNNAITDNFKLSSSNFASIKADFQTKLNSNPAMAEEWMKHQLKYVTDGLAISLTAEEAAKAGLYQLYQTFLKYINPTNTGTIDSPNAQIMAINGRYYYITNQLRTFRDCITGISMPIQSSTNSDGSEFANFATTYTGSFDKTQSNASDFIYANTYNNPKVIQYPTSSLAGSKLLYIVPCDSNGNLKTDINGTVRNYLSIWCHSSGTFYFDFSWSSTYASKDNLRDVLMLFMTITGVTLMNTGDLFTTTPVAENSGVITADPLDLTESSLTTVTTIPSVTNITEGTILNPGIIGEYGGAVPIDVPITSPIDPPIDVPDDPPADETLLGTVAAILAGITPISAILDNILASELDIADVIEVGITGVIDGITDIQSSLSTLTAPATETINLDPVKNIPNILFTKFPFSIPWDLFNVYNLMATDNRSPPEFSLGIPMTKSINLSSFGVSDIKMDVKLENYEEIAGIVRTAELLLFVIGLIFATKKLIWG